MTKNQVQLRFLAKTKFVHRQKQAKGVLILK